MRCLPFHVDIMAREDILHQIHCFVISVFAQLLSKVDFCTEEETDRPEPLLMRVNEQKGK